MAKTKKNSKIAPDTRHPWVGKTILAGITWHSDQGMVMDQRQVYGVITSVNESEHAMEVDLANGLVWQLPYYPEVVMQAPHGVYKCQADGQEVVNPDLVMSWRISQNEGGIQRGWQPNFLLFSEPPQPPDWEFTRDLDPVYIEKDLLERGPQMIGKHLLVGIQYYELDAESKTNVRIEQHHGEIVKANPTDGLVIRQPDDTTFTLPPDLTMLEPAPKGNFRLRATGELVSNPDYVAAWAVDRRKKRTDAA